MTKSRWHIHTIKTRECWGLLSLSEKFSVLNYINKYIKSNDNQNIPSLEMPHQQWTHMAGVWGRHYYSCFMDGETEEGGGSSLAPGGCESALNAQ